MHIVVCIKQIPDTNNVKWSKENNLLREGMISILNPYDEYAIARALKIKEKFKDTKITVFSMGPKQAKNVLEYALARGCDRAVLLCDKKFAGSDTLCTGAILAQGIKKFAPDYNLIICGQFALDGDTAQTGATIAGFLNLPLVSYVDEIVNADLKASILKQNFDDGVCILEVKNPCLICVLKGDEKIEPPKVADYVRAQNTGIEEYDLSKLPLEQNETGILGSPTFVTKAFKLEHNRNTKTVEGNVCEFIESLAKSEKTNG